MSRAISEKQCLTCGKTFWPQLADVKRGKALFCSRSCSSKSRPPTQLKHGMYLTAEYRIWQGMKARCLNPDSAAFKNYGARGITICKRWYNFEEFYADMGPRPSKGHSLERVDNDNGYAPSNCIWATKKEQAANRRNLSNLSVIKRVT